MSKEELLYKQLYRMEPQLWREPVEDWAEMVRRFRRKGIGQIPEEPPSMIKNVMTEEDFFAENREVVCFHNLRYGPPFVHRLEFIKIIYCMRGSADVCLRDTVYRMEEGNLCVVAPQVRHAVFSYGDSDIVINILMRTSSFSETFSGILLEQNILTEFFWKLLYTSHSNRLLLFHSRKDRNLDLWAERMYDESARGSKASRLLMKSYMEIFLGMVMRDHLGELQSFDGLPEGTYVFPAMIQMIRSHLKTITLRELSDRFGMQENEIKRYILEESGYSYQYLLRDLRMRRAAWLLLNTDWSVERIMEETGYTNLTNFYHAFKGYFSKTPQEYHQIGGRILI
ncbi:MAG: AraC family transcriptional regulator [Eubacteriales bacterium]|nr:AraC family transcriptional regulator [Eubacteriales bacterium]